MCYNIGLPISIRKSIKEIFQAGRSYRRDNNPKKCQKRPTRKRLTYPKI